MNKVKGIKDLMENGRYKPLHLSNELKNNRVPGNWDCYQNVYNLINGHVVPKDAYVLVVISELLNIGLKSVIYRYSNVSIEDDKIESSNKPLVLSELNW
jgi:hypothetical protein